VCVQGTFRRLFHWTEHPALAVDPASAGRRNEATNLALLRTCKKAKGKRQKAKGIGK